jgi:hypothetical protein
MTMPTVARAHLPRERLADAVRATSAQREEAGNTRAGKRIRAQSPFAGSAPPM